MSQYQFSIVTPSGTIFDEPVESVVVPGSEGFFGVLSNHTPIVSTLTRGVVSLKKENEAKYFVIDSGVLEVDHQNHCLLLSNSAEEVEGTMRRKPEFLKPALSSFVPMNRL